MNAINVVKQNNPSTIWETKHNRQKMVKIKIDKNEKLFLQTNIIDIRKK